ncbi:hypothetical protein BH11MYX1_BH11MYX1_03030 [soil metagenome]
MESAGIGTVVGFVVVVAATLGFAHAAIKKPVFVIAAGVWLALLAVLALRGFFRDTTTMPPHFALALAVPMVAIVATFVTPGGSRFIDALPLQMLTYLSVVRFGVELVLFGLAMDHLVPKDMTFIGHNFDIISGFSAPIMGALAFGGGKPARGPLLVWNMIAFALLVHVVVVAVLSAPLPFQQFNFDRPNVAVLDWPFVWLPGFVVPMALFCHLVAFRQLAKRS